MRRYELRIRGYVLEERRRGTPWVVIREGIKERFNVDPPTVRAMQKWLKTTDREGLSRMLVKEAERKMPEMEVLALNQLAKGLLPALWQSFDVGEDLAVAGWMWILAVMEKQAGSAIFERAVSEYMRQRAEVKGTQK